MGDDRAVDADDIGAAAHDVVPPRVFDVAFQFGAGGAVVPKAVDAAVDFRRLKNEPPSLAQRDDFFHQVWDRLLHHSRADYGTKFSVESSGRPGESVDNFVKRASFFVTNDPHLAGSPRALQHLPRRYTMCCKMVGSRWSGTRFGWDVPPSGGDNMNSVIDHQSRCWHFRVLAKEAAARCGRKWRFATFR